MRDVYGTSFNLSTTDFAKVRDRVLTWCLSRFDNSGETAADVGRVDAADDSWAEWITYESATADARAWTCTFRHRDATDPTLAWQASATVAQEADVLRFTLRLAQDSLDPILRPTSEGVGRPRIVRDLVREFGAQADGVALSSEPLPIMSDDVAGLVELLISPRRALPVVAMTITEDTGRPPADPHRIASELVGVAHTVLIATAPASYALTDAIGRRLSVFGGAIRIYWPGLTTSSDPYAHRLYLGRTVEQIDSRALRSGAPSGMADELVRLLGDIAALRVQPEPILRSMRREVEVARRSAERTEWMALIARERDHIPDEFAEEFDRQAERIQNLEFELDLRDEEVDGLRREILLLSRSFSDVQSAIARDGGDAAAIAIAAAAEPRTIVEAARRMAETYPDAVVVLDDAYDSAEETHYRHVDRAARSLQAIGEVAAAWHDNTLDTSFDAALQERGFDLRTTSSVTQGRWRSDYERVFEGERVLLGPHVAIGDGGSTDTIFRVYWFLDEESRRFIVGHIGRHLRDSST